MDSSPPSPFFVTQVHSTPSLLPLAREPPPRVKEAPVRAPAKLMPSHAFRKYLPLALGLAPEQVKDFKGVDITLLAPNLRQGLRSIAPYHDHIRKTLPGIPLDAVLSLSGLSTAILHAHTIVTAPTGVTRDAIAQHYAALQELRVPMLLQAQVFTHRKLVPAARVDVLRDGSGMVRHALQGIGLHALFTEFRVAIEHKHPFTPEEVDAVSERGLWLLDHVTPAGARDEVPDEDESRDLRNRFWTLITERHALLRRIGYNLFAEDEVDTRVPSLKARVTAARATEDDDDTTSDTGEDETGTDTKPS
jgi:hypothetical protein